ncbi:insulinase family protein [bacterium]|nr:insulinase family protein [bacterium]
MKLQILSILFLFVSTACTLSKQSDGHIQNVNGMEFSSLTLPNQLDVLLVSDSRFKKSSAAMAVAVGSLEDPESAQGMAHYLEHMLFLGTKEFPKADEYSTYMETHGGWDNAYTSDEVTNYMFEVDNAAIQGGLERFSRFFVSPSFDATFLEREKNAVNSEFQKNIKQDGWRQDRYINTLAKKNHPYRKFSTGSTKTLKNVSRDDVVNFYKKYYSANNMKLVIMSSLPTNELKKMATQYFSDVPNLNTTRPTYDDFYFDFTQNKRLHFIKTINDTEEIAILFNVPDETKFWKTKPLSIIAKLVGDEGPGSLLSYLKKQGLALELSASQDFWRTFAIEITLTPKGRKEYPLVLSAVESYLELVKKNLYPDYLFNDESALHRIALENLEPSSSGQRAAAFAKSLVDFPAREFLQRNYLISEYSVADFKQFLNELDLKKAHVLVLSKNEKTKQKEEIFGVEYQQAVLDVKSLDSLASKANLAFNYPPQNKYIPNDFSLVGNKKQKTSPLVQNLKDKGTIYVGTDTELGLAKASVKLMIQGLSDLSPQDATLQTLFVMCKEEELREWSYPISEAGAQFQIYVGETPSEIGISISGYSQRLVDIFRDGLKNSNGQQLDVVKIDQKLFEDIKQRLKRDLANLDEAVAASRLGIEARHVQNNQSVHWKEILASIDRIKIQDVQKFAQKFFSKIDVQAVAYGNIDEKKTEGMVQLLFDVLKAKESSQDFIAKHKIQYRVIPVGEKYALPVLGRNNNHAMLTMYNMAPWSIENHALTLVVSQLVSQPYFSELRTNQQLGYVARAGGMHQYGFVGLSAMLQSPKVSSVELQKKSHQFLNDFFSKKIKSLTDEELKPILQALENELLMTPTTLSEREGEFYQAAIKYNGRFSIRKELAQEIKSMKADKVKKFIQEHFLQTTPGILSFYYFGTGSKLDKKNMPGKVFEKPSQAKWDVRNPYAR